MDFQKAFDSVPRHKLFQKLLNHNINGKFYDCLVSIYKGDQACVKIGNNLTKPFTTNQGVKQGCILSPILFNIFLSDIQNVMEKTYCDPVLNGKSPLGCLIWADDMLLLSTSRKGLENMLAELKSYTTNNGMKLNTKKTKVMIFNKTGRHIRRNIYYGDERIETTREYKYLGFMVTPSGSITTGLKDLKDRANRALSQMKRKQGILFRKEPLLSLKLFQALIEPILLYASDFWGILLPKVNPIDTAHLSFCKQLLGVQTCTATIGVLLELGEIPIHIKAKKNSIKNWCRIVNNIKCNDLTQKSYRNANLNKSEWTEKIKWNIGTIGLTGLYLVESMDTYTEVFNRMTDIFIQESFTEMEGERSKLRTYKILKTRVGYEGYLSKLKNIQERTCLTKLRLSNHELMIEKGRHIGLESVDRFCPFCPGKVEDEIHFLLDCKAYTELRTHAFNEFSKIFASFPHLSCTQKFILMNDENLFHITAKYVLKLMERRKKLLEPNQN